MAEYIDKDIAIQICVDSWDTSDASQDIKDESPADVIERSEYEALQKENHELAIKYDNAMNKVINSEAALKRLHSKIDMAIKEMEINIKCNTDQKTGKVNILGQGQIMMLNILERNIGE